MVIERDADGFGPDDVQRETGVSRETIDRILAVVEVLRDWGERINLVGPQERSRIWRRHVWDSLTLLPHLGRDQRIVDLGSGSGFPALVVLAWQAAEAGGSMTMIESVGKKAAFLAAAAEAAGGVFHVKHARIEAVQPLPADIVTGRAVAALPKLLEYAQPWLQKGATGLFHKGVRLTDELTDAQRSWTFQYEIQPNRASEDGVILKISDLNRSAVHERDPSQNTRLRRGQPERRRR